MSKKPVRSDRLDQISAQHPTDDTLFGPKLGSIISQDLDGTIGQDRPGWIDRSIASVLACCPRQASASLIGLPSRLLESWIRCSLLRGMMDPTSTHAADLVLETRPRRVARTWARASPVALWPRYGPAAGRGMPQAGVSNASECGGLKGASGWLSVSSGYLPFAPSASGRSLSLAPSRSSPAMASLVALFALHILCSTPAAAWIQ